MVWGFRFMCVIFLFCRWYIVLVIWSIILIIILLVIGDLEVDWGFYYDLNMDFDFWFVFLSFVISFRCLKRFVGKSFVKIWDCMYLLVWDIWWFLDLKGVF